MEADLSRFHGLDLRDLGVLDGDGRRRLTLRMIWVRVKHLPPESACVAVQRSGPAPWTRDQVLLAHVWQAAAHSKEMHPMLAEALKSVRRQPPSPERAKAMAAARARAAERRRAIAAGEIL